MNVVHTLIQANDRYSVLFIDHVKKDTTIHQAYLLLIEPHKPPVPTEEPMNSAMLRICWASMVHGDRDANGFKIKANRCIANQAEQIGIFKAEDEIRSF